MFNMILEYSTKKEPGARQTKTEQESRQNVLAVGVTACVTHVDGDGHPLLNCR